MSKGISPVIASIILVLVVLSLASAYTIFTGRLAQQQTAGGEQQAQELTRAATTLFKIEDVRSQSITLRNIGQQVLQPNSVRVTIGGEVLNYTMSGPIRPGETGTLTLRGLWRVGPGRKFLEVKGAALGDGMTILVEPNEGNVLDMRFDENGGMTAFDQSGNANTGTLKPNASAAPSRLRGKFGNALGFDGVDDYVDVGTRPSLRPSSRLTVEAWIKPENNTKGGVYNFPQIVTTGNLSGETGYNLYLWRADNLTNNNAPNGKVSFILREEGRPWGPASEGCWAVGTTIPTEGVWYHMVGVYSGTEAKVYVDGALENTDACANRPIDYGAGKIVTEIGTKADGITWWGSAIFYKGVIDEVRIYDKAYTPDELYVMKRV